MYSSTDKGPDPYTKKNINKHKTIMDNQSSEFNASKP